MAQQVFVCKDIEMKDGDVRIIRQDKVEVGVYRHSGAYYAYRNHCLHQGGPACEGIIRGKVVDIYAPDKTFVAQKYDDDEPHIICPWHGWEYKLKTGECAPDPTLRLKKEFADRERNAIEAALAECQGRVSGSDGAAGAYVLRMASGEEASALASRDPLAQDDLVRVGIVEWNVHQIPGIGSFG